MGAKETKGEKRQNEEKKERIGQRILQKVKPCEAKRDKQTDRPIEICQTSRQLG